MAQKPLPFRVTEKPFRVDADDVRPDKWLAVQEATDERFSFDVTEWRIVGFFMVSMLMIGCGIFLGPAALIIEGNVKGDVLRGLWVIAAVTTPVGLYLEWRFLRCLWFVLFRHPGKQVVVFDRAAGTVTLPPMYEGDFEEVPFRDLYATIGGRVSSLIAIREDGWQVNLYGLTPMSSWSFYVWYMDKSRPLPPGSAFDPYRGRDEARRLHLKPRGFADAAEGIGNVYPLDGPVPDEAYELLPRLAELFARFEEIEWATFGGLVHEHDNDVDGLHFDYRTRNDVPLSEARTRALNQALVDIVVKLSHYRFVDLVAVPRPRGRVIFNRSVDAGSTREG